MKKFGILVVSTLLVVATLLEAVPTAFASETCGESFSPNWTTQAETFLRSHPDLGDRIFLMSLIVSNNQTLDIAADFSGPGPKLVAIDSVYTLDGNSIFVSPAKLDYDFDDARGDIIRIQIDSGRKIEVRVSNGDFDFEAGMNNFIVLEGAIVYGKQFDYRQMFREITAF
jgi:hypothetical protein